MSNFSIPSPRIKISFKGLALSVAIPLLVGLLSSAAAGDQAATYQSLAKPALYPPAQAFPAVWTALYVLMGISSYLVLRSDCSSCGSKSDALGAYAAQLFFNLMWPVIFFTFKAYGLAFIWLIVLWILIVLTMMNFFCCSKTAACLLFPYLIWVTFAAYLNFSAALLN